MTVVADLLNGIPRVDATAGVMTAGSRPINVFRLSPSV
jgi:hypothetical protein